MAGAKLTGGLRRTASGALTPWASRLSTAAAQNAATAAALLVILLAGLQLRVAHVNWDKGQHLHPDERFLSIVSSQVRPPDSLGQYFDSARSPLNPYNVSDTFVYGTLPIFLNKAVAEWLDRDADGSTHWTADVFRAAVRPLGVDMENDDGSLTFDAGYESNEVGRVLSALADVATIALVFELGRVVYGRRAGLLAAALLSVTVLHIQYSHFFGSETFLALFATATVYFSARILKYGGYWNYAFAGLAFGLAMATKLSALPVAGIAAMAIALRLWGTYGGDALRTLGLTPRGAVRQPGVRARGFAGEWLRALAGSATLLVLAGLVFRIAQPYAFNGPGFLDVFEVKLDLPGDVLSPAVIDPRNYLDFSDAFLRDIENLRDQQKGSDFPPNMQWIGRPFLLFPLQNIVLWGLGAPLGAAALAALVWAAYRGVRGGDRLSLLLAVWAIGYFLFAARGFNPTMRYFIPIYPTLALLAAFGLGAAWDLARSRAPAAAPASAARASFGRLPSLALQGGVVVVVAGTALWALAFTGIYRQDISRVQASEWIARNLPPGTALTSQEWDDAVPLRLPGIDPGRYEHVLLKPYAPDTPAKVRELVEGLDRADYVIETSNRLYGSIPRSPARYPSTTRYYRRLFDGSLGFEKVAEFTNYPNLFGIEIPDQGAEEAFTVYDHPKVTVWRKTAAYSHDRALALLDPDGAALAVNVPPAEASRNALLLRPDDLEAQQEGGTWTDVFSDGGLAGSAPTLLWLLAVEAASLGALPLALVLFRRLPDRGYLLAKPLGLLLLAYPAWLAVSVKLAPFEQGTVLLALGALLAAAALVWYFAAEDLWRFMGRNWRLVLFSEALFLLAFFFFRELRLADPDLWHPFRGGEKPMDLAYLTAVARSTTLPPYDPWFAGGYINYYYLGQFFTATLIKLTRIPPEVAFNLAVPTFAAMTAAGAFSVSYNLAAAARALARRSPGMRSIPTYSLYVAGCLGAALVTVAGNLDGVGQLVERLSAVSPWRLGSGIPVLESAVNSAGGAWEVLFGGARLADFDYWRSSRMLPPTISITEFPYFSFLFADLHAHMIAIPFQVLAIGVALSLALGAEGEHSSWRAWTVVGLLGLITGSLRWVNSWDYPPFLLLALAAVVVGERRAEGGVAAAFGRTALKAVLLAGVSLLAYQPFLANYEAPVSGLVAAPETTPMHQYLAHFGLFAAVLAAWLLFQLGRALRQALRAAAAGTAAGRSDLGGWAAFLGGCLLLFLAAEFTLVQRGKEFVAMLLPALLCVAALAVKEALLPRPDSGVRLFVLALAGLGLGLSMGVDLVSLRGDIVRMNTVFKFYLHVWVVFALAASFAAWQLYYMAWRPSLRAAAAPGRRALAAGGVCGFALLLLGAAVYPLFATPVRLDDRFNDLSFGLDGAAYMREAVYADEHGPIDLSLDYEGIAWMRENVRGTPAIVEGRTPLYRWGGRFSVYTGLPSVLGWDWHQIQQRGRFAFMVGQRAEAVDDFYADPDIESAKAFLRAYKPGYVILGRVERLYYPADGLRKLDAGLDGSLELAFANEELKIFRVRAEALWPALGHAP